MEGAYVGSSVYASELSLPGFEPFFPDVRVVADGDFGAVADNGGLEEKRMIEKLLLDVMSQILEITLRIFLTLHVDKVFDGERPSDAA